MNKLLLFFLLILSFLGQAQETNKQETEDNQYVHLKKKITFSGGIIFQHQFFLGANIIIGEFRATESSSKIPIIGCNGWRIGLESNFNFNRYIIAPKIGYEFSYLPFSLRLSTANYIQDRKNQLRLIPEFGISMGGAISLTYGYGIKINGDKIYKLSNHRMALTINLDKKLFKTVFL